MREVAGRYQDQLTRIKTNIRTSYDSFKHNYDRFNEFRRFVFDSSLKEEDITLLMTMSKPQLEFNILEAYISRLLGEFSKQEPSIEVSTEDESLADPKVVDLVEAHLRHALFDNKNHHAKYEIYKDLLSGGWSVGKIATEYANPMSFNQNITFDRVYDPTLCGFDHLARYTHKGDGTYCFELVPKSKTEFKEEWPDIDVSQLNFHRYFGQFQWAYLNDKTEIILVADYYEKKKKRFQIVQLNNHKVMSMDDYKKLTEKWDGFEQVPQIVGKPRWTQKDIIVRYRCIENQILEYKETDFSMLPLIFFDGNSILIRTPKNGNIRQECRPYVYHAKDAQRLKNVAGINAANEIENMVQHKFKVSKESLPKEEDWLAAYRDVQKASVLVYNAFDEKDPTKMLPPPEEIARIPMPPEIMQTFQATDSLIQNILGSYDASLGINNNQLSGIAIIEGATQSNSAAMPFIIGFLQGLQRFAECYIDLMPKYYTTPRTIPVMTPDGKKSYVKINQQDAPQLFYDENVLNVKVEAGVNFQIQKSRALQQIIAMSQASQQFSQFINEVGLPILIDNMELRGIDQLKQLAQQWMEQQQQQKQQAMQMQQQAMIQNPQMLKAQNDIQKTQLDAQKSQAQFQLDMQKLQQDETKLISEATLARDDQEVQKLKAHAEIFSKAIESNMAHRDMQHRHTMDGFKLHNSILTSNKDKDPKNI